jgi:hypothetical protein
MHVADTRPFVPALRAADPEQRRHWALLVQVIAGAVACTIFLAEENRLPNFVLDIVPRDILTTLDNPMLQGVAQTEPEIAATFVFRGNQLLYWFSGVIFALAALIVNANA